MGLQLLFSRSTEFTDCEGLNIINGKVENLSKNLPNEPVPHVGWNEVKSHTTSGGLFDDIPDGTDFYLVHSYAFVPDDPAHVLATTVYDISVTAAVRNGHIWGTQFHPEKSSRAGFRLLRNFIENSIC